MSARKGPFRLVTVNTAPERAKRLIGRLIEALKDDYDITYVDNSESMKPLGLLFRWPVLMSVVIGIDEVVPKVTQHKPNVLVSLVRQTLLHISN